MRFVFFLIDPSISPGTRGNEGLHQLRHEAMQSLETQMLHRAALHAHDFTVLWNELDYCAIAPGTLRGDWTLNLLVHSGSLSMDATYASIRSAFTDGAVACNRCRQQPRGAVRTVAGYATHSASQSGAHWRWKRHSETDLDRDDSRSRYPERSGRFRSNEASHLEHGPMGMRRPQCTGRTRVARRTDPADEAKIPNLAAR